MSSSGARASSKRFVLPALKKTQTSDEFKRALVKMVNTADHKLRAMETALVRALCAHHTRVEKHRAANVGAAYTAPTAAQIAIWCGPCSCADPLACACENDKTYCIAIENYEGSIVQDQVKNSILQANNSAGTKARASDLKFKVGQMHEDFIDAILVECVKLDSLKHCRELKVVDAYYKDLSQIDPDTIAFPHLWPLYELIAEVFLTLNRPSSDHGENHFARLLDPPNVHLSLASYQSHIKPAIDYLQSLQITDTVVLRDHLEAVSNINFIAACAHNKASPKDISSVYLTILRSIENEQAKDTNVFTMLCFKRFKDELRRALSS
jgi:hypothetical protein